MKKHIILAISATLLASCGHIKQKRSINKTTSDNFHGYYKVGNPYEIDGKEYIPRIQPDYDEVGISSWYGDKFDGKMTANGDTFDKNALTAAHNTLPLPSMVRVTNLENNKTLILMINDRGPFAKGRVIDVSERAADILGFRNKGIAKVRVQFLKGHTKRLLADLPIDPKPMEKKFSFFDREEGEDIYDDEYLETKGDAPLDLMPGITREEVMRPVKKLSEMIASGTLKAGKPQGNLPNIQINSSEMNTEQAVTTKELPDAISEKPVSEIKQEIPEVKTTDTSATKETPLPSDEDIKYVSSEVPPKETITMNKPDEIAPKHVIANQHFIQAGTYSMKDNAERVERKLLPLGDVDISNVQIGQRILYRVRLGPINDIDIAKLALKKVIKLGHADAMLVNGSLTQ